MRTLVAVVVEKVRGGGAQQHRSSITRKRTKKDENPENWIPKKKKETKRDGVADLLVSLFRLQVCPMCIDVSAREFFATTTTFPYKAQQRKKGGK